MATLHMENTFTGVGRALEFAARPRISEEFLELFER